MKRIIEWMVKRWLPGYGLFKLDVLKKENSVEELKAWIARYFPAYHISLYPTRKAKEGKE
jgi:hypothetical protein